MCKSPGTPLRQGPAASVAAPSCTPARGLLNDKEAEGTRHIEPADPAGWHWRAGLSCASPRANASGRLASALAPPRAEGALLCCCLRKPGFLSVTDAGTLPCHVPWRGQRGLSRLSQPSRAHVERGVAAAGPCGVPAAGRAAGRCLVANRIRARGGSQGGLLTLAPCFSA